MGGGGGGGRTTCSCVYRNKLSLDLKQSSDSAVTTSWGRQAVPVWYSGPGKERHLSVLCPAGWDVVAAGVVSSRAVCCLWFRQVAGADRLRQDHSGTCTTSRADLSCRVVLGGTLACRGHQAWCLTHDVWRCRLETHLAAPGCGVGPSQGSGSQLQCRDPIQWLRTQEVGEEEEREEVCVFFFDVSHAVDSCCRWCCGTSTQGQARCLAQAFQKTTVCFVLNFRVSRAFVSRLRTCALSASCFPAGLPCQYQFVWLVVLA